MVNNAVVAVQDSIEEAHLLHEDPKYLQRPQVAHDTKLLSLIKVNVKIVGIVDRAILLCRLSNS